jgi:hypothetical protein
VTKRCRVHLAVALPSRCGSNIADEASGCGAVMLRVDLETEKAVRAKSNRQSDKLPTERPYSLVSRFMILVRRKCFQSSLWPQDIAPTQSQCFPNSGAPSGRLAGNFHSMIETARRSWWSEGQRPRGMRASKARSGQNEKAPRLVAQGANSG